MWSHVYFQNHHGKSHWYILHQEGHLTLPHHENNVPSALNDLIEQFEQKNIPLEKLVVTLSANKQDVVKCCVNPRIRQNGNTNNYILINEGDKVELDIYLNQKFHHHHYFIFKQNLGWFQLSNKGDLTRNCFGEYNPQAIEAFNVPDIIKQQAHNTGIYQVAFDQDGNELCHSVAGNVVKPLGKNEIRVKFKDTPHCAHSRHRLAANSKTTPAKHFQFNGNLKAIYNKRHQPSHIEKHGL